MLTCCRRLCLSLFYMLPQASWYYLHAAAHCIATVCARRPVNKNKSFSLCKQFQLWLYAHTVGVCVKTNQMTYLINTPTYTLYSAIIPVMILNPQQCVSSRLRVPESFEVWWYIYKVGFKPVNWKAAIDGLHCQIIKFQGSMFLCCGYGSYRES